MVLCKNLLFAFGLFVLELVFVTNTYGLCLGTSPPTCLNNIEEGEANEKLKYVLGKYEEVEMKIIGAPIGVHGKLITIGETEELHIVFQYIDNTVHDVIQNCVFILVKKPGECETITTVCNTFLPVTPRPLLEREPLTVCDDDVQPQQPEQKEENEQPETEVPIQ